MQVVLLRRHSFSLCRFLFWRRFLKLSLCRSLLQLRPNGGAVGSDLKADLHEAAGGPRSFRKSGRHLGQL